jgi:hypothetical protein
LKTLENSLELLGILREVNDSHIYSEVVVSQLELERMGSDILTVFVRNQLLHTLMAFAVDHKVMNDPACISTKYDSSRDAMLYRTSMYVLSPAQLEDMLRRAYECGARQQQKGSFYTGPM